MGYSNKARYEAVKAIRNGATLTQAGGVMGASPETVRRWCITEGICFTRGCMGSAILPSPPPAEHKSGRLNLAQRLAIGTEVSAGMSHTRIAEAIGFSRSTVSREIARHRTKDGYDPYSAQMQADRDARRPKARILDKNMRARACVLGKLCLRWSPRQISAKMREDFPDDRGMHVSHDEAIYQALYVQGKGSLRQELKLEKALRSGRRSRLPRSRLSAKRGKDKSWVEGCEISLCPAEAADRAVPGHWEGDLVIGGDLKSCLITLVERRTRFLLAERLELHPTELVTTKLAEMAEGTPSALMRTVTWDQGMEMASHMSFMERTGVKVYFCDPHSPWQRDANENTNGLIRDYFPKGTDFTKVADEEVREMRDQLNGRPRETLGWKNPAEAFAKLLEDAA